MVALVQQMQVADENKSDAFQILWTSSRLTDD